MITQTRNEKLKKYISEVLAQDVRVKKALYQKYHEEYSNSLVYAGDSLNTEVLFKRTQLAKIKYAEAKVNEQLWQDLKRRST